MSGLVPDSIAPVQLLNYLAASGLDIGLVLQFGARLEIKRVARGFIRGSIGRMSQ